MIYHTLILSLFVLAALSFAPFLPNGETFCYTAPGWYNGTCANKATAESYFIRSDSILGASRETWAERWISWFENTDSISLTPLVDCGVFCNSSGDCQINPAPMSNNLGYTDQPFIISNTPMMFLSGVLGPQPGATEGFVERSITIPQGVYLFFPILNSWISAATDGTPTNGICEAEFDPEDSMAWIEGQIPTFNVSMAFLDIDYCSMSTEGIDRTTVFTTTPFCLNYDKLNIENQPNCRFCDTLTYGYYAAVSPLSVGEHTIHFGGTNLNNTNGELIYKLDAIYNIRVIEARML